MPTLPTLFKIFLERMKTDTLDDYAGTMHLVEGSSVTYDLLMISMTWQVMKSNCLGRTARAFAMEIHAEKMKVMKTM